MVFIAVMFLVQQVTLLYVYNSMGVQFCMRDVKP